MSEAIYAWLLRLYPEPFRTEYGEEARQLFRDRMENERGLFLRLQLWFDIIWDTIKSVPQEYGRPAETALAGAPVFSMLVVRGPHPAALLAGAAVSMMVFTTLHVAAQGGGGLRPLHLGGLSAGSPEPRRQSDQPEFEVTSVKPNTIPGPGLACCIMPPTGNRFLARNATLRTLIRLAFGYEDDTRILGGPAWMNSDRFDVEGKAPGPVPGSQLLLMAQSLLADRFRLKLHREMRDMPVYSLVVGKDGHKMERLKDNDGNPILVRTPEPGIPPPPPPPPPRPAGAPGTSVALRQIVSSGMTMESAASMLTRVAGRPVIDKTGLTGLFVFKLQWAPDPVMAGPDAPPPVSPGPSIFTAVQEQLGLRLEPERAPIEFLVVDAAQKPSEN